ncbi:MerR family transcriptional regulator [Microbacterium laevaniformans]|uniref:MerR family transcriptional regulator n=1 Tax=Microbacterium laevaniformans TaxID=36807 RepID=UPI00363F2C00
MASLPMPNAPVVHPRGLTIGEAARHLGVAPATIRYYENEGLTLSRPDRDGRNRRRYFEGDMAWLAGLTMLRGSGMTIRQMREYVDLYRSSDDLHELLALLEKHREEAALRLRAVHGHVEALDRKIQGYREQLSLDTRGVPEAESP